MVDPVETAQEQLEKAHAAHETHDEADHWSAIVDGTAA